MHSDLVFALTLCLINPPPGPVNGVQPRGCYELDTYASRTDCEINAQALRIEAKSRLSCPSRQLSAEERIALHVLSLVKR